MLQLFERHTAVLDSRHFAVTLIDLAVNRGIHPDKLLKGTKLFYSDFIHKQININVNQLLKIIENLQSIYQKNDISFLLGRRLFPGNLGNISNVLMNCRNFHEILKYSLCYQNLLFPLLFFRIETTAENTHIIIDSSIGPLNQNIYQFLSEVLLSMMVAMYKWHFDESPRLLIKFPFKAPHYVEEYRANFGSLIEFEQPLLMLIASNNSLLKTVKENSRISKKYYALLCRQERQQKPMTALFQFMLQIISQSPNTNLNQLAQIIQVSPATLKRKLKDHQSSFQNLVDHAKSQRAIYLLIFAGKSNEFISAALGFTDIANFRRAFKRWTGLTPSEVREKYLFLTDPSYLS